MKKSVSQYISDLLYTNDCVIVPNFGGFVGNRKSAELNKKTGSLRPPSKQILFNRNLTTNDGLLFSYIAQKEVISQEEAKLKVDDFVIECNNKLDTTKVLRIAKVGLFTVAQEGNIIFVQDNSINYYIGCYGMKPTYNKSIVRKEEFNIASETNIKFLTPNKQKPKTFLRAAAIIIPLVALSYISLTQEEKILDVYKEMASLNLFSNSETVSEPKKGSEKGTDKTNYNISSDNQEMYLEDLENEKILPKANDQTFYLVAGAFAKRKNANKMYEKLKGWNYDPQVLESGQLLRVTYSSFNNREEAILALAKIREDNPSAWMLTE